jgi:hypothetical protein
MRNEAGISCCDAGCTHNNSTQVLRLKAADGLCYRITQRNVEALRQEPVHVHGATQQLLATA